MPDSFRALCADFYVNQKLQVKMELPKTRETVLDFYERIRKAHPQMIGFRKYRDELALESNPAEMPHRWLAIKGTMIRTGCVNAESFTDAYGLHQLVLDAAPSYLSISPLDVDHLELLYGFDMMAHGNHDQIVYEALLAGSPLAGMMDIPHATISDFQPTLGVTLGRSKEFEVYVEVKTRPVIMRPRDPEAGEPISVYLTMRKLGPISDMKELTTAFTRLSKMGEDLIQHRIVPNLLVPINEAIGTGR
jgi:hypothetical protein